MKPILGFVIAPPLGVLLPVLPAAIGSFEQILERPGDLGLLLIPVAIAYASALFFGVPMFVLFKRNGWLRLWQVIGGSALCGIPFAVFQFFQTKMAYAPIELTIQWFGSILLISSVAGLSFWFVALRQRDES